MSGYDIISDVHGRGDALVKLLETLGYSKNSEKSYTHPKGRRAVYLGDIINRGEQNGFVLDIVQSMIRHGAAAMGLGNHELKAVNAAKTGYEDASLAAFHAEFRPDTGKHAAAIEWFKTLPLCVGAGNFRAVHACYDVASMRKIAPFISGNKGLTDEAYQAYSNRIGAVRKPVRAMVLGPTFKLPGDMVWTDYKGETRNRVRLHWWKAAENPLDMLDTHDHVKSGLSGMEGKIGALSARFNARLEPHLIFIGHYGLESASINGNVACIDVRDRLTAYRLDKGDRVLSADKLVCVPAPFPLKLAA